MRNISYQAFIDQFPEFKVQEQLLVEATINTTATEVNYYEGMPDHLQSLSIMLHVAHNLTLIGWSQEGRSGPVQSIRSNNDAITFSVNSSGSELDSTGYGYRLLSLLRRSHTIMAIC